MISAFLADPIVKAAIAGIVTAGAVDWQAFRSWKSAKEATTYDWATAGWRWFQGAIVGIITAGALAGLVG